MHLRDARHPLLGLVLYSRCLPPAPISGGCFLVVAPDELSKDKAIEKVWYNGNKISAFSFINMNFAIIWSTNSQAGLSFSEYFAKSSFFSLWQLAVPEAKFSNDLIPDHMCICHIQLNSCLFAVNICQELLSC